MCLADSGISILKLTDFLLLFDPALDRKSLSVEASSPMLKRFFWLILLDPSKGDGFVTSNNLRFVAELSFERLGADI